MKVYIAGRYSRRDEFRRYRSVLKLHGIETSSRWLDETKPLNTQMDDDTPEFYLKTAAADITDLIHADAMLFFAEDPLVGTPRGGRHVEFGYALSAGLRIYVVGPKENIFHYTEGDQVRNFGTVGGAIDAMLYDREHGRYNDDGC